MVDRLISADALLREAMKDGAYGYVDAWQIKNAPTIDAIPVVRCKDCKHYWKNTRESDEVVVCLASSKDDAFCSEGERREDDGEAVES